MSERSKRKPPNVNKFTVEQELGPVKIYQFIDDVPEELRACGEHMPDGTYHVYLRAVNIDEGKSGTIFQRENVGEPWSNATKPNQKRRRGPKKLHSRD